MWFFNPSGVFGVVMISFVLVDVINNAAINEKELKKLKSMVEGQGLYVTTDDVEILTVHNFNSQLYGKKNAWIIEFYNTWCGHCQRFAPTWKAFAKDVFGWKDLIPVAAIDCSEEDNSAICRNFDIMGYPTLRYFHENYDEGTTNIGDEIQKGTDVNELRRTLLTKILEEQRQGRGKFFPDLSPYLHTRTNELFSDLPSHTSIVFLVMENKDTLHGASVAMDLHSVSNVAIRFSFENNTELVRNMGATNFPSIFIVEKNGQTTLLTKNLGSREKVRSAITDFLKSKGISTPEQKRNLDGESSKKWTENNITDMATLMRERQLEALNQRVKLMGDVVFQMDLETALRFSLKHEVSGTKHISGEAYDALKAYINVLTKYFPFGKNGQTFLNNLKEKLDTHTSIDGSVVSNDLANVEDLDKRVFSSAPGWIGCRGSKSNYRGYPCSIWKMFHYLTVNAAEHNANNKDANPKEVLDAMLGYVKHFFGCADCSRHFQEMVAAKDMKSVSSSEASVLWLWMAHNTVNKRLAGDETEDPEFPKYQFPSSEKCTVCRNQDSSWNYPEVLKYLKHMYSNINIRYIGSDTRIIHAGLEGVQELDNLIGRLDGSMCFILYVFSFILIAVLIRMFLKRGYRKKLYVHDILGKV